MDMAPVEGTNAAGKMDMPAVTNWNGRPSKAPYPVEVDFGKVGAELEGVDMVAVAYGDNLAGNAGEAVVVGYVGEDGRTTGLGGNHILCRREHGVVHSAPSLSPRFFQYMSNLLHLHRRGQQTGTQSRAPEGITCSVTK